jgi:predicted NUDIX family NTP pyrophosphohydrolase
MPKISAGILLYRFISGDPEVLLFHPGGPYWAKKDKGVWSIAKGEVAENETVQDGAIRELEEESGIKIGGDLIELKPVNQKNNKIVHAWALEQDFDPSELKSNLFDMEWPPSSGKRRQFPEMDRAVWFTFTEAKEKIVNGQLPMLEELEKRI